MSNTTFRVTIEIHHPKGGVIGSGTRVVLAADGGAAGQVAVAEAVAFRKAKNDRARAEMARTGRTWPLDSENPADYTVKSVRKAPQRRAA
jgi:hypothetical protein